MSSMSKFCAAAVLAAAGASSAYAATMTPVPVNLNQNIVTIVLILGVVIGVTLIYALAKLIPKCRRGEVSLSKIDFDWRAELLNQTSKKEKARRAAEKARREEEMAAGNPEVHYSENGTQHYRATEPLSPVAPTVSSANGSERRPHVEVRVHADDRNTR